MAVATCYRAHPQPPGLTRSHIVSRMRRAERTSTRYPRYYPALPSRHRYSRNGPRIGLNDDSSRRPQEGMEARHELPREEDEAGQEEDCESKGMKKRELSPLPPPFQIHI
ncbi:hypothetical protein Hypma_003985 [Hypsizygus marmoreus]|uniref:Uncharacterized protein n=1 Tax=Hypsizygus marmoreus TaxID=39966 RepID=A0A369J4X1_HYPMA|nr:hypothetical protein Hypma_003985 [Hypsizygus marmoreus]